MGTTRGFWDPEDGTVESFDETIAEYRGADMTRSKAVLEAMVVYEGVLRAFGDAGWLDDLDSPRAMRDETRQAIRDHIERFDDDA